MSDATMEKENVSPEGTADTPAEGAETTDGAETTEGTDGGEAGEATEEPSDDPALTVAGKDEQAPAKSGKNKKASAPKAEPLETVPAEQPGDAITAYVSEQVRASLRKAADEFQSWLQKGETPDGSRADMAVITYVVAYLQKQAADA